MEQRKVMSLGRSSLVVSLPKHWIKLNELKRGDSVSVTVQRDRSLVIFPGRKMMKEAKNIWKGLWVIYIAHSVVLE